MLKRILVALSGTPYTQSAVGHALELARAHDADVTGVSVTDLARLAYVGAVPVGAIGAAHDLEMHRIHVTQERIEQNIAAFESACRAAGVRCGVARETGTPLDELKSLWRYHDFTIFGLRGLFEYGVVHNPDDMLIGLIKHGVRPILAAAREHRAVRRVLIAYNGSMESAKAMKQFVQTLLWPDPVVRIVCFDHRPDKGRPLLADAASYCEAHGLAVETALVDAPPRQELLKDAAAWGADLIVMGATARSRIFQHVLGDTVLTAVRHSDIPLFLTQ
jgi:nucleotide-binding universal stress UspA family protein